MIHLHKLPPVPTRFWVSGDVSKGKALIPLARSRMTSLRRQVESNAYSSFSQRTQNSMLRLPSGAIIKFTINHMMSHVDIFYPVRKGGFADSHKQFYNICFCSENFAMCKIISRKVRGHGTSPGYDPDAVDPGYTPPGHIADSVRYVLEVCNEGSSPCSGAHAYARFEDIMLTDFADVVPDSETTGEEAGFVNYGLVMIYTFEDAQTNITGAEGQPELPESACSAAPRNYWYSIPVYKIIPILDPLLQKYLKKWIPCDAA